MKHLISVVLKFCGLMKTILWRWLTRKAPITTAADDINIFSLFFRENKT